MTAEIAPVGRVGVDEAMRFLFIISNYPPRQCAGMEQAAQRLAEALGRRGHGVLVLTQRTVGLADVVVESTGVTVHRVLSPIVAGPLWGLSYMGQVRRWVRKLRDEWDTCVCRGIYLHSAAAIGVCRKLGKPMANMAATGGAMSDVKVLRQHRGGEFLVRKALRADGHYVLTAEIREELRAEGVPEDRLYGFRNFVDRGRFHPGGERDPDLFLFLGRLDRQKNLPLLIDAFERVYTEHPAARLRIVGSGPEEGTVWTLIERSPASGAISLAGWTAAPEEEYRRAGVFVLPSDAEGLSNALLEAMACGMPCVCTDVSGAREALGDEEGGLIVPAGDAVALAGTMGRMLGDAALRERLSAGGIERVTRLYGEEGCVGEFLAASESIIERHRREAAP